MVLFVKQLLWKFHDDRLSFTVHVSPADPDRCLVDQVRIGPVRRVHRDITLLCTEGKYADLSDPRSIPLAYCDVGSIVALCKKQVVRLQMLFPNAIKGREQR